MKIKIYSTEWCVYCKLVKDFLKEHKIAFEEVDVGKDENAAMEMVIKSGQEGVPVIEIGDEIVIGFDKEKLKKLLGI
ncbi:MAG: glutaredoxin domain-containing protein [Candidatus Aenigmarchaeota archaeon]|nr:glutaredoxin domain-containing protein [Candidatus Aenigmarchaeota archaeon]